MKKLGCLVVLVALIGSVAYLGFKFVAPRYDRLVSEREAVRREWAQVDTLLQRRYDLIPNLVETVKGYTDHEAKLLTEIADAHSGYLKARSQNERMQAAYKAEAALGSATRLVMASYPQLRADAMFGKLMGSLENTEEQIARQRMVYNEVVAAFNADCQTLLGQVVSRIGSFEQAEYYNPPTETAALPRVDFANRNPDQAASAASQAALTVRSLVVTGMVDGPHGPEGAIVQFPDHSQRILKVGEEVLELRARVKLVDARGVTFEERTLDEKGAPVTRVVRVDR
jgi:LemA protein